MRSGARHHERRAYAVNAVHDIVQKLWRLRAILAHLQAAMTEIEALSAELTPDEQNLADLSQQAAE